MSLVQFSTQEHYNEFKELHEMFCPVEDPFRDILQNIVPRKSTYVKPKPRTDTTVEREIVLTDTNFMLFNVQKQVHVFFQGLQWRPHHLVLELIQVCNLFQVTV